MLRTLRTKQPHWWVWKDGRANILKQPDFLRWTTCWWTQCAGDHPLGLVSESISGMCRKHCGRRRKLPIPMTIRRANGGNGATKRQRETINKLAQGSTTGGKNCRQFLGRNNFELGINAVARL